MEEKKFSLIVMAFVFIVAVPSMVFLFSDTFNATGEAQLYISPQGMAYAYQKDFQYGPREGVDVPLYDAQGNLISYEKRVHTKTGQKKRQPYYEETYTGMKQKGCPPGYFKLNQNKAAQYESMGRNVERFGDQLCWYPGAY